jgi:beta-glucanase (GH16 family)
VQADVPNGLGPTVVKSTLHGPGYSGGQGQGQEFRFPRGGRVDDGFHVYGAIWSAGQVQFYVDDVRTPFLTVSKADLASRGDWAFDKPFYLILNLAVGGTWPGDPGADTPNPARLLVDYVRVYTPAKSVNEISFDLPPIFRQGAQL